MSPFDRVLIVAQLMVLAGWEALGTLAFDWNGLHILAFWFIGLWTFNVLTATAVRTFFKLMQPQVELVEPPTLDEDDLG